MRRLHFCLAAFAAALLIPASGSAQTGADSRDWDLSGSVDFGWGVYLDNDRHESPKFDEYREVPNGGFGDAQLHYRSGNGYHVDAWADDITEDDQSLELSGGRRGSFEYGFSWDKIPHRFAYGTRSLYSGVGDEEMRLPDSLQAAGQNAASLSQMADILEAQEASAFITDIQMERQRGKAVFELQQFDPFTLAAEVTRDERKGTRPLGVGFGFGNAIEVVEPVDWRTTEYRVSAEYAVKHFFASASYYLSAFENKDQTLLWDNPFRLNDSTSPTAYLSPTQQPGAPINNVGPATGLYDLTPDNLAQYVTLTGAVRELPLQSQLTLQGSLGWLTQDDDLVPYTSNTAVRPQSGFGIPFDASNPANLPAESADREVNTALISSVMTSNPLPWLDVKGRYRFYEWENESDVIHFPGYVRFDSTWEEIPIATEPVSYRKQTAGLDLGFDVIDDNRFGLDYTFDHMSRDNREVDAIDDNRFKVTWDNSSLETLTVKTAYEHSIRRIDGDYDPYAPFEVEEGEAIPQLPYLRKYDEADRKRDEIKAIAVLNPLDNLGLSASASWGRSDYDNSDFGLTEDQYQVYGIDVDYAVTEQSRVFAFWSIEHHDSDQRDRQWNPGGAGDPFTTEPALSSNSNWTANQTDTVNTVGVGGEVPLIEEKLKLRLTYSLSVADGNVDFSSPVGTAQNDTNPFEPDEYSQVDDTVLHMLNSELVYAFNKNFSLSVGYLWEKYDADDFSKDGYMDVPRTTTGAYNGGLFMGALPYGIYSDYDVNWAYTRVRYTF